MEVETLTPGGTESGNRGQTIKSKVSEKHREANELILALIKTVKSYRIYASKNPILKRFVDQLHRRLGLYLTKHGSFRLEIEESAFLLDGEVFYENEEMAESLPFLMHRNGLTELWFDDGLAHGELTDFLETFRSYEILKDSYEDLVTLLWDKEFSSIHFLATDDFLWTPVEIPQTMKDVAEKMEMPTYRHKHLELDMPLPRWLFKQGELDEIRETIPQQIEEVDYINLLMILAEVVSHSEKEPVNGEPVVDFFKVVLDSLLIQQDLKNLIKILSFTKILVRDRRLDAREKEFIQKITDYLGEPQSIKRLMGSLARLGNFEAEELQTYLFQLSKNAIAPLCEAWLEMQSAEGRVAICNALMELGKEDIPTLGRFLKNNSGQLVLNVIRILGKIGQDECIHPLTQVTGHENAKVRNEALHALSLFDNEYAKAFLPGFLNDPEMHVRINASKILAEKLEADALPHLEPIIRSGEFIRRDLKEKRAFLENLGRIQDPDSVRILEEILHRRVILKDGQWRRTKSCVESILAAMDLGEARKALANWRHQRQKWVFRILH